MMKHALFLVALSAVGCDAGAKPAPKASVTLTSVAFADDCGGTPPATAPVMPARRAAPASPAKPSPAAAAPAREPYPADASDAVRHRCEQTSMQLSIVGDTQTQLQIKSVEVFDADGKSLGKLTASKPTRWNPAKAAYEAWDEKVGVGTMAVSYVLSQPAFVDRWDARDRTYTVKVNASLGGKNQPLKTTVMVVGRPPPVPT